AAAGAGLLAAGGGLTAGAGARGGPLGLRLRLLLRRRLRRGGGPAAGAVDRAPPDDADELLHQVRGGLPLWPRQGDTGLGGLEDRPVGEVLAVVQAGQGLRDQEYAHACRHQLDRVRRGGRALDRGAAGKRLPVEGVVERVQDDLVGQVQERDLLRG